MEVQQRDKYGKICEKEVVRCVGYVEMRELAQRFSGHVERLQALGWPDL